MVDSRKSGLSATLVRLSIKDRTKKFEAVLESRKWKESIAEETCGMTVEQVVIVLR